jgi:DNA-binding CsgD family transcriptional regulator
MGAGVLLERDGEFAVLDGAVNGVGVRAGSVVVVSGAAGIGKTELLDRARQVAARSRLRVLSGRGSLLEREYPFGLVRQLFQPLLLGANQRDLWSGAAGAAREVLLPTGVADLGGEFAALHGLFWLVSDLCRDEPLVVVLDDLHWADEPSLRFVAYLLPRLDDLRLLLVLGLRPDEPGAASDLLDLISVDAATTVLRPAPLSLAASGAALADLFGVVPEREITAVCHEATGGNPFLLAELARSAGVEGLEPTRANAQAILRVGALSLSRRVALQLSRMAAEHIRLAEALAVLGPGAELATVAGLAGLTVQEAARGLGELEVAQLVRRDEKVPYGALFGFVHPLLQAAVYEQIKPARRAGYHAAAVSGLREAGASPELAAAHLLRLPPAADADTVAELRHAAAVAVTRGAPETAATYLRRALAEPAVPEIAADLLTEAGMAAARVDLPSAAEYLQSAMRAQADPIARARIAQILGLILVFVGRVDDAVEVLTKAIAALPPDEEDSRRMLQAVLLNVRMLAVGVAPEPASMDALRALRPRDTLGGRVLDGAILAHGAYVGDPQWIERVRRIADDPGIRAAAGQGMVTAAMTFWALVIAGADEGLTGCTAVINDARQGGAMSTLTLAHIYRGIAWLQRGELAEAETDLREAQRLAILTRFPNALPVIDSFITQALVEQGRTEQALETIARVDLSTPLPAAGLFFYPLFSTSSAFAAAGRFKEGLQAALAAGDRFATHGGWCNPAVIPWRSQAAICLHALGETDQAIEHATLEIDLARRWGAPFAIGRALRVAGRITPGKAGLDLLHGAVNTLTGSTARLEYAKTLIDLGAALRRINARIESRRPLAEGLELAYRCGATGIVDLARTELRAAGARPRRLTNSGLDSLTTSERRVADLAVQDLTNRQIAQQLFITTKTVEVHLSAVYRKLGITQRRQLHQHLKQRNTA